MSSYLDAAAVMVGASELPAAGATEAFTDCFVRRRFRSGCLPMLLLRAVSGCFLVVFY